MAPGIPSGDRPQTLPPCRFRWSLALLTFLLAFPISPSLIAAEPSGQAADRRLRVFLDCFDCHHDFLRTETTFVDFVRERTDADLHLIVTRTSTAGSGGEHTIEFIDLREMPPASHTLKTVTSVSDPDDVVRRQLASAVQVGLLRYAMRDEVPAGLDLSVRMDQEEAATGGTMDDPWNAWVFSVRGSAWFNGERSRRELEAGGEVSADRITPDWKATFGASFEERRERFTVDEREVRVSRQERDFNALVVNGIGEHWSVGVRGELQSSTFENISLAMALAPAVEFNVFPYSVYTRRQLRLAYAAGAEHLRHYEETLFGKLRQTLPLHELSVAFDQTEPWGNVEARAEWRQYLNDLTLSRLETEARLSWRLARGFSLSGEVIASRIRDQISLPSRGATPEEVLLDLRELQSGYEYFFEVSLTYTFGSIFSAIVNPRFGQ